MKFMLGVLLAILLYLAWRSRQRTQLERIRSRRRFEPDWGRLRTGAAHRRRRRGMLRGDRD